MVPCVTAEREASRPYGAWDCLRLGLDSYANSL